MAGMEMMENQHELKGSGKYEKGYDIF